MRTVRNLLLLLLVFGVGMWLSTAVAAQESPSGERYEPTLRDEVRRGFASRISILGFGIVQEPEDSRLNPNNTLEISRYQTELDLRPDLNLSFRRLELSVKPRLELRWQRWEDGVRQDDSETDVNVFVNEWLVRYRLINQLFVSYGRENLQWGPSYLLSPSNPFNRDNGQNNPRLEVPGLDYGRVIWVASANWTVSLIANTDEGRQELIQDFKRTYAIKLDYTGVKTYFSLIVSSPEDIEPRGGFFAGWTVSEALLLYAEGSFPDAIDEAEFLVGGAYTLERGPTIVIEFFRDGSGCTLERIDLCFDPGFGNARPEDILFRQNYLLVQYIHTRILDTTINLVLRWIRNLDDDSNRVIGIFESELGAHIQPFVIGNVDVGAKNAEFGSLLHYSVMAGIRYTF